MFESKARNILDLHMQRTGEETTRAGNEDPPILLDEKEKFGQQVNNNEQLSPNDQEASKKSSRGSDPSIPHPFNPQSFLENEGGGHGMYRHTFESLSRSSPDGQQDGKAFLVAL